MKHTLATRGNGALRLIVAAIVALTSSTLAVGVDANDIQAPGVVASGSADAADDKSPPSAIVDELSGRGQPFDAWELRERLAKKLRSRFGGLHGDGDAIVVSTTSDGASLEARSEVAAAQAASDTDDPPVVDYRVVRNSFVRLARLDKRLQRATRGLEEAGVDVTAIELDDSANRLVVGLADDSPAAEEAVLRTLRATREEIVFETQAPVPALANRFDDVPAWNAGDRIFNENSPRFMCTAGFGVHNKAGHHYLLTAAHCSSSPGLQDFFWNGDNSNSRRHGMGFSTGVSFGKGWDTQLIDAPSSTISWTAFDSRSYITASYTPVKNDRNQVINEGATSNTGTAWQSGAMKVIKANTWVKVRYHDGSVRKISHLWVAQAGNGFCAVKGGDSGGPIVAYTGLGPLAIGQIVAGDCGVVYFHAVKDMLAKNPYSKATSKLSVNTISAP